MQVSSSEDEGGEAQVQEVIQLSDLNDENDELQEVGNASYARHCLQFPES
jgi:hypothetical protein